jgi:hypothetical protein
MNTTEALLTAILGMVARQAISPTELARIISPTAGGSKQIIAYNLCDGRTSQKEICKKTKLDQGSLSRSISRWIEAGIEEPLAILGEHMPDDVSEKLDILIKLQAAALTASFESVKDKILFLNKAGLRPILIAEIVGTTPNHVNVTLSKERKPPKGKGAKNGN